MKDILICNFSYQLSPFIDNLIGKCEECYVEIYYRPHAPKDVIRLCITCGEKFIEENKDNILLDITPQTKKELIAIAKN